MNEFSVLKLNSLFTTYVVVVDIWNCEWFKLLIHRRYRPYFVLIGRTTKHIWSAISYDSDVIMYVRQCRCLHAATPYDLSI